VTTLSQLRKAALALPEVEQGSHVGLRAFAVRGKRFQELRVRGVVPLIPAEHRGRFAAS
jgi:hypothetical protein